MNIIDTGGLDNRGSVTSDIQAQIMHAINTADAILLMLDAREGVNSLDLHFSKWIRRNLGILEVSQGTSNRQTVGQVVVLANKTEGAHLSDRVLDTMAEAFKLGM
jgi:predicted GTPase